MLRIFLRSGLFLLASAFVGSLIVFCLLQLLGGDAATIILGQDATAESLAALRTELGLDKAWYLQYLDWLFGLFRGDLGTSYAAGFDIWDEIRRRFGLTFSLAFISLTLSCLLALVFGTYSALHAKELRGEVVDVGAQLGMAVPSFWAGLLLILFFAVKLGWLPSGGYVPWSEDPWRAAATLVLPVAALSVRITGQLTRFVRSAMIDVMSEDYIRTAMAKGRTRRAAAVLHGIRNASIPLVTVGVLQLGTLLAGAVVIENVFTLPGLGRMLVVAVGGREAVVVLSLAFVILVMILVLNFLMDIMYGLLDPRIRDKEKVA